MRDYFPNDTTDYFANNRTIYMITTSTTTNTKNIVEFASMRFEYEIANMHHFEH